MNERNNAIIIGHFSSLHIKKMQSSVNNSLDVVFVSTPKQPKKRQFSPLFLFLLDNACANVVKMASI